MPIKTSCDNCGRPYTLADDMNGKQVRCKSCNRPFQVRAAPVAEIVHDAVAAEPDDRDRDYRNRDRDRDRDRDRRRDDDWDDRDRGRPRRRSGGVPLWVWLAGGGGLLFLVVVGVVLAIVFSGSRVTEENFKKLHSGMTEAEVLAILGRPSETIDGNRGVPPNLRLGLNINAKSMVWKSGRDHIEVAFLNGQAMAGSGEIGGKVMVFW
jgi:hypothetical protein